jgi:hypothetical protein
MKAILDLLAWFFSQPTLVQVAVGIGALAALYAGYVILRLLATALYGGFRGLG